jgi:hypothetical protein
MPLSRYGRAAAFLWRAPARTFPPRRLSGAAGEPLASRSDFCLAPSRSGGSRLRAGLQSWPWAPPSLRNGARPQGCGEQKRPGEVVATATDSAPSHRAISGKRPRPHSEARPERGRHVVERRAAHTADLERRRLHPKPVAARGTFRIQTLNRPAGQILHGASCLAKSVVRQRTSGTLAARAPQSLGGFCVRRP